MKTIAKIESKLKRSGTDPKTILNIELKNRSFLDRVKVPKSIYIGCCLPCFKC